MIVQDAEELRRLPSWVAVYRAAQALLGGDAAATVAHGRRALDLLVDGDDLGRGAASALIGLASWGAGTSTRRTPGTPSRWRACSGRATSQTSSAARSRWRTSRSSRVAWATRCAPTSSVLRLAAAQDGPVLRGTADMYVGMAALHRERGDLRRRQAAAAAEPGARRARRAAAEPAPLAGRDGRGPARPKEIWTVRSTSSRTRSGSTPATSLPTCVRSRP